MMMRSVLGDLGRIRAGAVVAAAVASPLVGLALYVAAQSHLAELGARTTALADDAVRLQQAAAAAREALASHERRGAMSLASDFLPGSDTALIAADLQSRLRSIAQDNNLEMNSAYVLPVRSGGPNQYVGVRMLLRGEVADLQRMLHVVETGAPLLFIERATLRVDGMSLPPSDPSRGGAPMLIAEIDVFGARLPDASGGLPSAVAPVEDRRASGARR